MSGGSGGSTGLVPNGVRVLSAKGGFKGPGAMGPLGMPRSYSGNGGAGIVAAVSFSEDPAALKATGGGGGAGGKGGTAKGVLLNEGKSEKLYWLPGIVSTGGPLNGSAMPVANNELPCGIVPNLATS